METVDATLQQALGYHRSGRLADADRLYRKILADQPQHADALHLSGLIALQRGQYDLAVQSIDAAIRVDDRQPIFQNSLGEVNRARGQFDAAMDCYRRAIALAPQFAAAHNNLGMVLQRSGALPEARQAFQEAIRLKPEYAHAHYNLGIVRQEERRYSEAIACYREALRLQPAATGAIGALAVSLQLIGELDDSVAEYRRYLDRAPQDTSARLNLATALQMSRRFSEAEAEYHRLGTSPSPSVEVYVQMGNCAQALGKLTDAAQRFRKAIALDPERDEPHFRLGAALLAAGDFRNGWPEYEWRLRRVARDYSVPVWDGRALNGQRIILYSERGQGLGDTLQFVRYVPLVERRGGDVILAVQPQLFPLLKASAFGQLVAADQTELPNCEYQAATMSLPRIFCTALDSIPAEVPYLAADSELVGVWRHRLQPYPGFRIGIHWHGSEIAVRDGRVIPLQEFEALARVPGVTLVSLQKSEGHDQITAVAASFDVVEFGDELDEHHGVLMDSAAIMKNLDLVVTNDTVIAHLAGALGVPVWVALLYSAEWRWLTERDDSPWYPGMRLFRQPRVDDWRRTLSQMAEELRALVHRKRSD